MGGHQGYIEETALEGKAAHPPMSETSTLMGMFSLPMQPLGKLVPHSLVLLAHFPRHHHPLVLMAVHQSRAKTHQNVVLKQNSDASRWHSMKTSATGKSVQQGHPLQQHPQHPLNQHVKWIEMRGIVWHRV